MDHDQKFCLATVTNESYFQWTMTMLHSFVTSNPWFSGDIAVICNDLPAEMASGLKMFSHVKLIQPSSDLLEKLAHFVKAMPAFHDKIARFFSLEIFRFSGYEKVLFLDSDMIVVKTIEELFGLPDLFYASAELCWYKGKGRNASNFHSEFQNPENREGFLSQPVNTGFMLLDGKILNDNHFNGLLNLIAPELWQNNGPAYTDELVINHYFKNAISLLDTRYNYRARAARMIRDKEKISLGDAKIIHYYSKFKPWNFDEVLTSSINNITWINAYEIWYQYYISFLTFYHLQKKLQMLKQTQNNKDE
jgi:lipopolysaccharide biosynthesis glycosyltransferase